MIEPCKVCGRPTTQVPVSFHGAGKSWTTTVPMCVDANCLIKRGATWTTDVWVPEVSNA